MAEPSPRAKARATPATVTISWTEYRALVLDAAHWRHLLTSPHVAGLLAEWVEWDRRRTQIETSNAISAAAGWRAIASHPTYAELKRRRTLDTTTGLTPEQIRAQTDASWAQIEAYIGRRRTTGAA
jgi:hypothetical protein